MLSKPPKDKEIQMLNTKHSTNTTQNWCKKDWVDFDK